MRNLWIWLSLRKGLQLQDGHQLFRHFGSLEQIYGASGSFPFLKNSVLKRSLMDKDLTEANRILEVCREKGIRVITLEDPQYPNCLKNIPDPPPVLYCLGQLPDFDREPAIGVVGTRRATAYGRSAAMRLSYQIASCGGLVVSGGAAGIDTAAMEGALQAGKPVAAVLGCGVDVAYPAANRRLFQQVQSCGCLISEYPPGSPPLQWHFPRRNRIISGLSVGILVVEAPLKSGALQTAAYALEQNRDVYAVPGNIDVETFAGSNRLLREGAAAVSSGWDILAEYRHLFPDRVRPWDGEENPPLKIPKDTPANVKKPAGKRENDKKAVDNSVPQPYSDANNCLPELSPEEALIWSSLESGACLADELVTRTGLPIHKINGLITLLQIKGLVKKLPGNRVTRNK